MKVFVNDISLEFKPAKSAEGRPVSYTQVVYNKPSFSQIMLFYQMAKEQNIKGQKEIVFLIGNYEEITAQFRAEFKVLQAAGGIVRKQNQLLFIHRLGRWDLPKGKIEKGEDTKEAATREVEEECGVVAHITKKITQTWHTYTSRKGNEILKCTHWFAMDCIDDSKLAPQTEEDIEEVRWVSAQETQQLILQRTYNSIRDVVRAYQS